MTTLTDRYVYAATRFVQAEDERTELGMELRERITDTVTALEESGVEPTTAERQALVDLGDPLRLSAEYRQKPMYVVGPRFFYTWMRVLIIAISTSAPIVAVIQALAQISAGDAVGEVIVGAFGLALSVAIHVAFWVTLTFAVVERVAPQVSEATWTPDLLPQVPTSPGHSSRTDLVASIVILVITGVLLVWQQLGSPFTDAGGEVPILDPALWVPWLVLLLVIVVAEIGHAIWVYRSGWSWPVAVANAVLALAFAALAVPLLLQDRVLNPELVELLGWTGQTATPSMIAAVAVIAGTVWEIAVGFVRAGRGRRA